MTDQERKDAANFEAAYTRAFIVPDGLFQRNNVVGQRIFAVPEAQAAYRGWIAARSAAQPLSPRGNPIVLNGNDLNYPRLTVELYPKWYGLILAAPKSTPVEIPFSVLEDFCGSESPYVDHAPNPRAAAAYAEASGLEIDELAYELMIGRWEQEGRNKYTHADMLPAGYKRRTP